MRHAVAVGDVVFPARAGVIPVPAGAGISGSRFPRASGGDPLGDGDPLRAREFSPRERG